MNRGQAAITDVPLVSFGREVCGDLNTALRREWLVTNGLGGFASGTVAGANTRRYHALLMTANNPPGDRFVLAGGLVEEVEYNGERWPLSTHEWGSRSIEPGGFVHCESFRLEGMLPVWTYAFSDALIEKRIWMAHEQNTTYVSFTVLRASQPLSISIRPLLTCRPFHSLQVSPGWPGDFDAVDAEIRVPLPAGLAPLRVLAGEMEFTAIREWYWDSYLREEGARGLDTRADLFVPGEFRQVLGANESCAIVFANDAGPVVAWPEALAAARQRQRDLLKVASADGDDPVIQQLVLAADQFIVQRNFLPGAGPASGAEARTGRTIIAGYHWFGDWGRDAMVALPGLTLATGRFDEAAEVLRTFARHEKDGLLPNFLPDSATGEPEYNSVDAALWFVYALRAYRDATNDHQLVKELLPAVRQIISSYAVGTRFGIGADPSDGLLRAGDSSTQLTWMDARVRGQPVTPRSGKTVEVNALWYNALRAFHSFLDSTQAEAQTVAAMADRVRGSFRQRFVDEGGFPVADGVDGPDGDDFALRPNAIFAASLREPLLDRRESANFAESAGRALYTSYGLRSLARGEPGYRGHYGGNMETRDGAYHRGTAWSWLIGPWVDVQIRLSSDPSSAAQWLNPMRDHVHDAGLGTISEIFSGDAPHTPAGCIAQAWGVAEVLRALRLVSSPAGA
ncbi:MAG: glycogen debranching enzyme family protein [Dehalococcoidia bacterium]|nr:glycogen debranching enzyme family protein [Dehalococcoidia bacterium]MCB9486965.1 glycogen debranching enzyme family protein [Thermoflexaceae bacterium]